MSTRANICQEYALLNRETMANIILQKMFAKGLDEFFHFQTIHNYINFKDNIIRKGSISAYLDEKVLIPINGLSKAKHKPFAVETPILNPV